MRTSRVHSCKRLAKSGQRLQTQCDNVAGIAAWIAATASSSAHLSAATLAVAIAANPSDITAIITYLPFLEDWGGNDEGADPEEETQVRASPCLG